MRLHCRVIAIVVSAGLLGVLGLRAEDEGAGDEPKKPAASLHDGFETLQAVWEREHTDTTINLIAQERSVRAAHEGSRSERFQFEADAGSQFFVSYALPRIEVTDSLQSALYVRANRSGVQLYGRVVLAGGHRSGDQGPFVRPDPGDDLRPGGPLATARARQPAARRSSGRPGCCGPRRGVR